MKKIFLEGSLINSQEDLHGQIAAALEFPSYYGKNLDALWDCLSDYTISLQGQSVDIIIKNSDHVKKMIGADYLEKVIACFSEARDEWDAKISIKLG
jgi:ribonuclease inhibitor